jgi:hypothetical protein
MEKAVPNVVRAGRVHIRLCQPFLLIGLFVSLATPGTITAPARLLSAKFSGRCDAFTFTVSGEALHESHLIVSYNIMLTPRSGDPIAIVDSFPVAPEADGRFHGTVDGTWKKFEFTLSNRYTLSGSAILTSDNGVLHTLAIQFPKKKLTCG